MSEKIWKLIHTETLTYGYEWKDAQSSIKAMVFGQMLELAEGRIQYYRSDLFHDAKWLEEKLTGPMQFEWIARESGSFIGESALTHEEDNWPKAVRYRFDVSVVNDDKWVLNIYQSVPVESYCNHDAVAVKNGVCECGYVIERGCTSDDPNDHQGDTCPIHESSDGTFTEDDQGNWRPVDNIIKMIFGQSENPTPRNESIPVLNVPDTRKVNKMEDILRDLREKYEEASNSKDQLEEYKSDIDSAIDDLDTYMTDLDDLINSLDSLPEVSVYVDLDTVSFDS